MTKLNYTEIEQAVKNRQSFKGNSCKGFYGSNGYTIYSYATEIYSDVKGFNSKFYSSTTSRLQNIICNEYFGFGIDKYRQYLKKPLKVKQI